MNYKTIYEAPKLEQHDDWRILTMVGESGPNALPPADLLDFAAPEIFNTSENQ